MKKMIYQIGEKNILCDKGAVNLLNDKEMIIKEYGKEIFDGLYKKIANDIREEFGFNYYLSMHLIDPEVNEIHKKASEEVIIVLIYDLELTNTTKDFYTAKYDRDKKLFYVEVN